jgi:hypothetical protein
MAKDLTMIITVARPSPLFIPRGRTKTEFTDAYSKIDAADKR